VCKLSGYKGKEEEGLLKRVTAILRDKKGLLDFAKFYSLRGE